MIELWRKGMAGTVAAASVAALVMASSLPAEAGWREHHGGWGPRGGGAVAAGIIGGLALGALAGSSRAYAAPVYAEPIAPVAPVYAAPVVEDGYLYARECHREWRPVYAWNGAYIRDRRVTVCD